MQEKSTSVYTGVLYGVIDRICDADVADSYLHEFFWIQILCPVLAPWNSILSEIALLEIALRIRIRMDPHR
jgi:hypothetical protein